MSGPLPQLSIKAADSPRWCDRCQSWGDHHTDRCPPFLRRCDRCSNFMNWRRVWHGWRCMGCGKDHPDA